MFITIDELNYTGCLMSSTPKGPHAHACEAWQLLVRFASSQRAHLPALAAELELSPA